MQEYNQLGFIGRFRPFHIGAFELLYTGCKKAQEVIIGIGSANKYNERNPFTANEAQEMIDAALKPHVSNYRFVQIPDSGHLPGGENGKIWIPTIKREFGTLDAMVSGNPYVQSLLANHYKTIQPKEIMQPQALIPIKATIVRNALVNDANWQQYVPPQVATYIQQNGLDRRIREEFGEKLINQTNIPHLEETHDEEQRHVRMA